MTRFFLHAAGEQPINKHFIHMERHLYNQDIIGCSQREIIVSAQRGYGNIYWSYDDIKRLHKESENLLDPKIAKKLLDECQKKADNYWKTANQVLGKLDNHVQRYELASLYDQYMPAMKDALIYFITISDKMTFAAEEHLKQIISSKFPDNPDEVFILLTTSAEPDLLYEELRDWLILIENPDKDRIIQHTRKYPILLPNTFSQEQALTWAYNRIKGKKTTVEIRKTISESDTKREQLKKRQSEILNELDSIKAEQLSWFISKASLVRLLLKACWNGEAYYMLPLYEKIAKIAKCSIKDIYMFYTWRDINVLLHNNINLSKTTLGKRKEHYLMHYVNWKIMIYEGEKALGVKKWILDINLPDKTITSFSGRVANKGKVTGKVKLVKSDNPAVFQEIANSLTKEHILVTGMTNPAMMVLIDKVKGIITDEGGIASHAAIISRELGIPCVVGTKIATEVLNEGEIIELDADNGIIKRIK